MKFELLGIEKTAAMEFVSEHLHPSPKDYAIHGGHIDYIFSPNSVAYSVHMKCRICDEEQDITDYGTW